MSEELQGLITVDYEEVAGSPVEVYRDHGFEAKRIVECVWSDRLTLAQELRGGRRQMGEAYTYVPPQQYPHYPAAVVSDVRIEPFGAAQSSGDPNTIAYQLARLTVEYRVAEFGTNPAEEETLITESLEPAAEFMTMPAEKLYWDALAANPLVESEAPQRLVRMLEWVYTKHMMASLPNDVISLTGTVNDAAITSSRLGLTFPVETLLYNPPRLERQITTEGVKAWKVTFRFTYRPGGWNAFARRGHEDFQPIYKQNGTAFKPYTPASFSGVVD